MKIDRCMQRVSYCKGNTNQRSLEVVHENSNAMRKEKEMSRQSM